MEGLTNLVTTLNSTVQSQAVEIRTNDTLVSDSNEIDEQANVFVNVTKKDKGKVIAIEEGITIEAQNIPNDNDMEVDKELEDELARRNLLEMQTKAYFADMADLLELQTEAYFANMAEQAEVELNKTEVAASWLGSLIVKELNEKLMKYIEKEEEITLRKRVLENISISYLRRPKKVNLIEKPEIEKMVETPKAPTPATFSRKKPVPKRKFKKSEEAIIHVPSQYKLLYETIDDGNKRRMEQETYLYEHGCSWKEVFGMSEAQVEESIQKIKASMNEIDIQKDRLVFFLKANDFKNRQFSNMKIRTLKSHVENLKKAKLDKKKAEKEVVKEVEKFVIVEKVVESEKHEPAKNLNKKKRKQWEMKRLLSDKETESLKKFIERRRGKKHEFEIHKKVYVEQVDVLQKRLDSIPVFKKAVVETLTKRSLQPFTRKYFDSNNEDLVVERGNQEPIRVYDHAEPKWLSAEDM
ncbi:hypothetical protein L1987_45882 [Smallanthus sonchifolius]|uniref:Uncharacterized protein n=1 Tax=Smallanthus sonchifolius TaxID=185202 RepID=A0ACB9FYB2_9ASTR|nr:hypothetical protein L1987_45882 [Smallanthus sonchifolius]